MAACASDNAILRVTSPTVTFNILPSVTDTDSAVAIPRYC